MALRLLALAAAATVAADVVQVAVLCDSRTAAGRAEGDMSIAAVDAINNKRREEDEASHLKSSL